MVPDPEVARQTELTIFHSIAPYLRDAISDFKLPARLWIARDPTMLTVRQPSPFYVHQLKHQSLSVTHEDDAFMDERIREIHDLVGETLTPQGVVLEMTRGQRTTGQRHQHYGEMSLQMTVIEDYAKLVREILGMKPFRTVWEGRNLRSDFFAEGGIGGRGSTCVRV